MEQQVTALAHAGIVTSRLVGRQGVGGSETGVCFLYGTPLMAVYVVAALLQWMQGRLLTGAVNRTIYRLRAVTTTETVNVQGWGGK